jgi:5'-AMP-activated protein kinase catalytic alpha subunit
MVSKQKYNPTKVDVWSSGIILFAMNCGFLPFEDKNVSVLYNKIKKGEFRMPSHLSDSLKDLLKNVLNVNPEERFSVDQILAHPWVIANARRYQALPYRSLSSDDGLLERVSNLYGFEKERLKRSLETNKHNAMTTAFYLYVKKEKIRSNNREIALTKPEHQTTAVETVQPTPNVK